MLCHVLAAGEMAQVSSPHLPHPQAQLNIKGPYCSVHVRDDALPALQLQVQWQKMSHRNATSHRNFLSRSSVVPFPLESCCIRSATVFLVRLTLESSCLLSWHTVSQTFSMQLNWNQFKAKSRSRHLMEVDVVMSLHGNTKDNVGIHQSQPTRNYCYYSNEGSL